MALSSDNSIKKFENDKLNFTPAAQNMANSILALEQEEGFVIGIEGEWGSGKTSFIDLIKEEIGKADPKFQIVDFQPWLYSGRDDLITAFFGLLYTIFKDEFKDDETAKQLGEIFERLSKYSGYIPGTMGKVAQKTTEYTSKALKVETPLEVQFEKIQVTLKKQKNRFLVVIDDLDRLEPAEIKAILQMVKTVGKLPYVTYILSYDRVYVEKCIKENLRQGHASFLEKIIQLPVKIPKPACNNLLKLFDEQNRQILNDIDDNERWPEIVDLAIKPNLRKPRDIAQISNAITFNYPALRGYIDPADFLALEFLRLFKNEFWLWIRDHEAILFGLDEYLWDSAIAESNKEKSKAEIEIDKLELTDQQKNLLALLFPRLEKFMKVRPTIGTEIHALTVNRQGIASQDGYRRYFSQFIDPSAIPPHDLEIFLTEDTLLKDKVDMLEDWLEQRNEEGQPVVSKTLEALRFQAFEFKYEIDPVAIEALWQKASEISAVQDKRNDFDVGADFLLTSLIIEIFKKVGKQDSYEAMKMLLNVPNYLEFQSYMMLSLARRTGKIYVPDILTQELFTEKQWNNLSAQLADLIAKDLQNKKLDQIQEAWRYFQAVTGLEGEASEKLRSEINERALEDPNFMKTFSSLFLGRWSGDKNHHFDSNAVKNYPYLDLPKIAEFAKTQIPHEEGEEREKLEVFVEGVEAHFNQNAMPN